MKRIYNVVIAIVLSFYESSYGQNWYNNTYANDSLINNDATTSVHRTGNVAIYSSSLSSRRKNVSNGLAVLAPYEYIDTTSGGMKRTAYFGINEPLSASDIGIASRPTSSTSAIIAAHNCNFKKDTVFTDVHNSTLEVNMNRGLTNAGFADQGQVKNLFLTKFRVDFNKNDYPYITNNYSMIQLRVGTGNAGNTASVDSFYVMKVEPRGSSPEILKNPWGIYIEPANFKNYFAGKVGIGTNNVTNALTVSATSDPIKIIGLTPSSGLSDSLLSVDSDNVVHKKPLRSFQNVSGNITISASSNNIIYIHDGGDVVYSLPDPSLVSGLVFTIVNIGNGTITTTKYFYDGNDPRKTIIGNPGACRYTLLSNGQKYVVIN